MKYLILFLLMGFSPKKPDVVIPPVKPFVSIFPKQEWTDYVFELVKNSELAKANPRDQKEFCPRGMNPMNYVHLIASMAKYESSFRPDLEYKESFKNSKGQYVISTGLLQISLESSKGYNCGMESQADLKDPYKNLACGVKILERWIVRDGVVAEGKLGGARYWSVLRLPSRDSKVKPTLAKLCE